MKKGSLVQSLLDFILIGQKEMAPSWQCEIGRLHCSGFTIPNVARELLLFSGGTGNSDILRQPDSIRMLRCLNRPANPKIRTNTDVERTLRPAGIFTKFIYCQMRFIFLFLVLAYSCKPQTEFVNPVYPYYYVPDFQPGDSIFFQDSVGNEISYSCFESFYQKKSYDWSGGTKEFTEGSTLFSLNRHLPKFVMEIGAKHTAILVSFWSWYGVPYYGSAEKPGERLILGE